MDYIKGWMQESYGNDGHLGIQIMISMDRELTENDKRVLRKATEAIEAGIMAETILLDPKEAEFRVTERAEILALFPTPIYVEEIPNGYCHSYCCLQKPWYVVTTPRGRITIGWRKRVLVLDWEGTTIPDSADTLFPSENVTRLGRSIHAWGYDKARAYIQTLLNAPDKKAETATA